MEAQPPLGGFLAALGKNPPSSNPRLEESPECGLLRIEAGKRGFREDEQIMGGGCRLKGKKKADTGSSKSFPFTGVKILDLKKFWWVSMAGILGFLVY